MIKTTATINNKLGLHARASAKLTKLAGSHNCEVWMAKGDRRINAKSIICLLYTSPSPRDRTRSRMPSSA